MDLLFSNQFSITLEPDVEQFREVSTLFHVFLDDPEPDDGYNYKQMMARDERRFKLADQNGDQIADKEEFTAFLHPEEYEHMKDIVVLVGKLIQV